MSQAHTTQDMNHGTSENKSKRGRPKKNDLLPPVSTVENNVEESKLDSPETFENKIAQAQISGNRWVETDQNNFDYQCRNFKIKSDHFMYKNVLVTTYGKIDEIAKRLGISTDEIWVKK